MNEAVRTSQDLALLWARGRRARKELLDSVQLFLLALSSVVGTASFALGALTAYGRVLLFGHGRTVNKYRLTAIFTILVVWLCWTLSN